MFKTALVATLAAAAVSAQGVQINTPGSLTTCQPVLLQWTGGQAPYYLSIIPGGNPSGQTIRDFGKQDGNSFTWIVDVAAGESVTVKIVDGTGAPNYADKVSVNAGSTTDCVKPDGAATGGNSTVSTGSAAGAAGVSAASGAAASPAAHTGSTAPAAASGSGSVAAPSSKAATPSGSASGSAAGTASAAASASAKSGAERVIASVGLAGVMAAVALLF